MAHTMIGRAVEPTRHRRSAPHLVPFEAVPAAAWDRLAAASAPPMMAHLWLGTAAEVYARHRPAQVLLCGDAARPAAAAALYAPPEAPGGLRLLGALDLGESVDLPATGDGALSALACRLWRIGRPVDLGHLPTDTRLLDHLRRHRPAGAVLVARPKAEAALPRLVLDGRWSDPAQAIGRKRRQALARKRRRAAAGFGPVETRILAPDPQTAGAAIARAFAVEANGWKSRAGTALAQQPRQAAFFRRYGLRAAERGLLRIAFLEIGGTPAAVHYGVEIDGVFWSLRIGYDERFAAVSPGELLMFDLVKACVGRGIARIELCGKEAGWTRRWAGSARPIAAVRLYPRTPQGLRGLVRDAAALGARRARAHLARAGTQ